MTFATFDSRETNTIKLDSVKTLGAAVSRVDPWS